MNPSLKSASMLLEIQIIVTFYHKNQLHKELLNTLLKKNKLQTTRIQKCSKTQEVTSENIKYIWDLPLQ